MNPGKDIGKKELPENVRAKFTDFVIDDISEKWDLFIFAERKLDISFQRSYQPNNKGKLIFMEGVLLQAMKNGSSWWTKLGEVRNFGKSQ